MKYYYLDGTEKKGPYSLEEMRSRNLSQETMIHREDKANWLALSVFDELNLTETIKIENTPIMMPNVSIDDEKVRINVDSEKIQLPKYTILILLIVFSIGIAGLITYFQQKSNYNKISDEIDVLFKGKTSVSDYYCSDGLEGTLHDVVYHPADPLYASISISTAYVEANGISLFNEPNKSQDDKDDYRFDKKFKQWEMFKNLKQYYIRRDNFESNGFEALSLSRSSDVFTITSYFAGDMAYKVPEKTHTEGTKYDYFSTEGYDTPTYRPTVNKCYEEAAKFLTVKGKDSTYVSGSYSKIFNMQLGSYKNDFYEVKHIGDRYLRLGETIHIINPNGDKSYVIDNNKITSTTSRFDACVFSNQWIVWYKSFNNSFALEPKKGAFLKYFSIYSTIGIILSILIFFFIKNRKRIVFERF